MFTTLHSVIAPRWRLAVNCGTKTKGYLVSISISVMGFEGVLTDGQAEEMANKRIPYGDDNEICRLFQCAGSISGLLIEAGEAKLPFTFLSEGSKKYSAVSDPTWSINSKLVKKLNNGIKDLDGEWAKKVMRPWGKSYIREINRAKAAGATAYRNTDPKELYERSMDEVIVYLLKLISYVKFCSDQEFSLLVCRYEDW